MNKTNLTQHGRSTDVYASDVLYPTDKKNILKKEREFIKNDVLLWQFMLCKNINQYNSLRAALTGRRWNMNWKIDERWH